MIKSTESRRVRDAIRLRDKAKERNAAGRFVLEGLRTVTEIPPGALDTLFLSEDFLSKSAPYERLCRAFPALSEAASEEIRTAEAVSLDTFTVCAVTNALMQKMSDTAAAQGVLAVAKIPAFSLVSMLEKPAPLLLLTEHLQDPGNLGTIFRTAEGAGADGLILSADTVDPYRPKVVRSTMGSIFRVPHVAVPSLPETVEACRAAGVQLYAAALSGNVYYDKLPLSAGVCFMIGNEANGLSEELLSMADQKIKIPMAGQLESLNAGVAASVLLYEANRQRRAAVMNA